MDNVYLPIIIFELVIILIIIFVNIRSLVKKINKLLKEKREWVSAKSKLSMIESKMKDYKEGKNAFTVLRDIQEVLWKDDDDEEYEDEEED